jgi:hypothetical protein
MTGPAATVLERSNDVVSAPTPTESARGPTEALDTRVPVEPIEPARLKGQEVNAEVEEGFERAAEGLYVLLISLTLLALFVVIFVSYLVLAAARLL